MENTTALLEEEFDLFIAYHGTDDANGSLKKAHDIYNILSKHVKCFFNPISNSTGRFTDTPTVAKHSKLFLLVANDEIHVNAKNEIITPGLYKEIDAFYNSHFNTITSNGNARVFAYNNLSVKRANDFHIIFSGSAHFSADTDNDVLQKLINWVDQSLQKHIENHNIDWRSGIESDRAIKTIHQQSYEGIWNLIGEFEKFQGDFKSNYFSNGKLILTRIGDSYKTIYCYSVSKEFEKQARVTAICEGTSTIERSFETNEEQLVLICDIITRTATKKLSFSSSRFRMILTPHFSNNGIYEMVTDFITKNTKGKLVFKRG